MKPEYLLVGRNRIAVYRSGGEGPVLLFIHGNSASSRAFKFQLEGAFGRSHQAFAIDLPGHGESDGAAEPEFDYTIPGYAAVLSGAAKALGLDKAVYIGWSLGGHILLEAAAQLPNPSALVLFGTPPLDTPGSMAAAFLPNPAMSFGFTRDLTRAQAAAYTDAFFRQGMHAPKRFREDALRTDGRAREILNASIGGGRMKDESRIVAGLSIPLAVLHGAEEQLVNAAFFASLAMPTLWRGKVQVIQAAGHAAHWEQPERFNELLDAFIRDVFA